MIHKDLSTRIDELDVALRSLDLSLGGFHEASNEKDAKTFIYNLLSPLRNLIAVGGQSFRPRLLNLADELGIPLSFFAAPEEGMAFVLEIKFPERSDPVFSPTAYAPNFLYQKT